MWACQTRDGHYKSVYSTKIEITTVSHLCVYMYLIQPKPCHQF